MQSLDLTVTVDRPMPDAQTQILGSVDSRIQSAGFTGRPQDNGVNYRPKFTGLVFVWLVRRLQDEHVLFAFEQRGPATEVRVTGKLRSRARAEVTEALGGY
jgi:hypothetical protein